MSRRGERSGLARMFLAVALISMGMAVAGQPASGAEQVRIIDITDHEQDYSDPVYPEGPLEPLAEQSDAWCKATYTPAPARTYTFSTITRGSVTTVLKADEYRPDPSLYAPPYPLMILAHGGGFARGCRKSIASVAYTYTTNPTLDKHFIVLSIDYRLACDPTDPSLGSGLVAIQRLCGWKFKDPDPIHGNARGPAVHDMEDAVHWARTSWQALSEAGSQWNGAIAAVGGSGGGNLAQLASIQWPYTDAVGPEALAGWSPFPRFTGYVPSNPPPPNTWACALNQSQHPTECSIGYSEDPLNGTPLEGGINRYIPCPNPESTSYQASCEADGYKVAAPYDVVQDGGLPPAPSFLANGGGPDGVTNPEDSALQPVQNYGQLVNGLPGGTAEACVVDAPHHAVKLLGDSCEGDTGHTVRQRTDTFLVAYVCDALEGFLCGG